jgi:hypothetical protein
MRNIKYYVWFTDKKFNYKHREWQELDFYLIKKRDSKNMVSYIYTINARYSYFYRSVNVNNWWYCINTNYPNIESLYHWIRIYKYE